jgi:hypothetical protein
MPKEKEKKEKLNCIHQFSPKIFSWILTTIDGSFIYLNSFK